MHVKFFHNLIREQGKITKKETSVDEKTKDRLFKERCSRNEMITDHENLVDQ